MAATVEETTREGYPAIRLANGDLTATFVPQLGMIGASLTHRGDELLGQRNGLPAYEARGSTMGIPLLHPWANRLAGMHYEAGGKSVTLDPDSPRIKLDENGLPIHGLLTTSPHWQTHPQDGALHARLDFGAHPDLLEAFPFPHAISHQIGLEPDGLTITTTVDASEGQPVPISFGFHPYLALPDVPRGEWNVEIPVEEHLLLDDESIPTGETEKADEPKGPLGDRTYDDGYAKPTGPFVLEGGGRRISVEFKEGYPFAQVYAPEGQNLICFEPMTAPTNALVSGNDLHTLQPGDSFTASFEIGVQES